MTLKGIPCR